MKGHVPNRPYVFLNHRAITPMDFPYDPESTPDLFAVEEGVFDAEPAKHPNPRRHCSICSSHVVSVVECNPKCERGWIQASDYCSQLMESRPDMPGVYGLSAKAEGYQVLWSDACGVVASPVNKWTDLDLIMAYVYSLYFPPKDHILFDPTITSSTVDPGMKRLMRTIKSPHGVEYSHCVKLFTGCSRGHRTSVWRKQGEALVIKDSFWEDGRRFEESALLRDIHNRTIFPGIVRILESSKRDSKKATIATAPRVNELRRMRTRLVLGSYGQPLENAESVRDILMAIYDVLEGTDTTLWRTEGVIDNDIGFSASRLGRETAYPASRYKQI